MVYETNKIRKIIEYKDTIEDDQERENIEWLISKYNDYYADSKEMESNKREHSKLLKKFYTAEEEKVQLKELIIKLRRRNSILKCKLGGN